MSAGVAPRHARRAVFELAGHFDDLLTELQDKGIAREEAEVEAAARLNPDALVAAAIARRELHSWVRRWPLASCIVVPLAMYMAFVLGSIALVVAGVTVFDQSVGVKLVSSRELQQFVAFCLNGVAWAIPVFAAGAFCSVMLARRSRVAWTLIGAALVSVLGATLNAGLLLNDGSALQAGFGFSTEAMWTPTLRAGLTLAIVLPIYFWRRAVSLGRARDLSASQFMAIGAVVLLHVGIFMLLMSARVPRLDSHTDGTSMELIVIPPEPTSVVVPERVTPVPVPSRENVLLPPAIVTETPPPIEPIEERAQIDWAREAASAASRQVDEVERERRRARGFTPEAQSREPEIRAVPTPEFGWSATAQRVESLSEGGVLIHVSERCVILISVMLLPACGIGEIPANGDLFEHMNAPPVLGDWNDDSALPR